MINVAQIPYLNCVPFYWDKSTQSPKELKWIEVHPKALGGLAREGKIDAGPVSLVDSFELEKDFEPLSDFCIAVKNAAGSVFLFSNQLVEKLNGRKIGLTSQSVTSVELLKMILEERYAVEPVYQTDSDRSGDARLLIGDDALKAQSSSEIKRFFPFCYDLGAEWFRWQGLPFVFARWMVRKEISQSARAPLVGILERNLRSWHSDPKSVRGGISAQWNFDEAIRYLQGFQYRLGEAEKKSIAVFRSALKSSILL